MGLLWTTLQMKLPALRKGKVKIIAFRKNRSVKEFFHDINKDSKWDWDKGDSFANTLLGDVKYMGERNGIPYFVLVEGKGKDIDLFNVYKPQMEEVDLAALLSQTWDTAIATERELNRFDATKQESKGIPMYIWAIAIVAIIILFFYFQSQGGIFATVQSFMGGVTAKSGGAIVS